MHADGERKETERRLDGLEVLDAARYLFSQGRIQKGMDLLESYSRKEPGNLSRHMDFLVSAVRLAILYQRMDLAGQLIQEASRWLERNPSADRDPGGDLARELELLKLFVRFWSEGAQWIDSQLERAFEGVRSWKPWMLHFRWLFLLNRHRMNDLEEVLRNPPPVKILPGTLEYAARLECLGIRFAVDRNPHPASIVLQAALRKLEGAPEPEGLFTRAVVLSWLSRVTAGRGKYKTAFRLIREAAAISRQFGNASLKHLVDNTSGYIHYHTADFQKSLRAYLKTCLSPDRNNSGDLSRIAMGFLNAARSALRLGRIGQARRLLSRAQPLIRSYPHSTLRGFQQLIRGELSCEKGTPAGYQEAREFYDSAEKIFQSHGTGYGWWLGHLSLSRGVLYLKEENVVEALQQADRTMELGKQNRAPDLQGEGLLLKSHLLFLEKAPRLDLYEMILRKMNLIRDPVVLFQLIANLYIYSWDLGENIELTDLHLNQLDGLSEVLPAETYSRLYQKHVTNRVVIRLLKRFGVRVRGQGELEAGA